MVITMQNQDEKIIEKIEVVGGYLNIYVNKQTLAEEVLEDVAKNKEKLT